MKKHPTGSLHICGLLNITNIWLPGAPAGTRPRQTWGQTYKRLISIKSSKLTSRFIGLLWALITCPQNQITPLSKSRDAVWNTLNVSFHGKAKSKPHFMTHWKSFISKCDLTTETHSRGSFSWSFVQWTRTVPCIGTDCSAYKTKVWHRFTVWW